MTAQTQAHDPSVVKLGAQEQRKVGDSLTTLALRRLRRDKLTLVAMAVFILLVFLSYTAPITERYILHVDFSRTDISKRYLPPGTEGHVLGTDDVGRDFLARLLYAGQISLSIALGAAVLSLVIGVPLGVITGYYGGLVDDVVTWVISTLNSIPSLLLLIIISAIVIRNQNASGGLISGPTVLVIVLALLGWTGTARLVRGETLSIREREYIISARAVGASPLRVMFGHIIPNLISVVLITLAIDIGGLILTESALSFLGLGVQEPFTSWGNMLTDGQELFTRGLHLVVAPGLMIVITVLCLFLIGDGFRDAFDPTTVDK
jgi:peptide/nickel transport system permease protein